MRWTSVGCTVVVPRRARRRLGTLVSARCRRPARARSTFPPSVILKRLATDFLVLMPLGRRIIQSTFPSKKSAQYRHPGGRAQAVILVRRQKKAAPRCQAPPFELAMFATLPSFELRSSAAEILDYSCGNQMSVG